MVPLGLVGAQLLLHRGHLLLVFEDLGVKLVDLILVLDVLPDQGVDDLLPEYCGVLVRD